MRCGKSTQRRSTCPVRTVYREKPRLEAASYIGVACTVHLKVHVYIESPSSQRVATDSRPYLLCPAIALE